MLQHTTHGRAAHGEQKSGYIVLLFLFHNMVVLNGSHITCVLGRPGYGS